MMLQSAYTNLGLIYTNLNRSIFFFLKELTNLIGRYKRYEDVAVIY